MSVLLTNVLQSGWLAKAAEPVRWLIVAGIAWTLATAVLYFMADPANATTAPTPAVDAVEQATAAPFDLQRLRQRHLFGKASAAPVQVVQKEAPAKVTKLPLELHGVFVDEVAENSAAIVAQKNKAGKRYKIGESVPGNATLIEVHSDHVVLRRAGARETLHFFSKNSGIVADQPQPQQAPVRPRNRGRPLAAAPAPQTPREFVEHYRDRLKDNPDKLLSEMGISAVNSGSSSGYRLDSLSNSTYLTQTGLQPGDVVLSINGRPVGDVQSDQMELDNVLAQGSARLEVQRGSRRFYVTASLK